MAEAFIPTRSAQPVPAAALLGLNLTSEFQVAERINRGMPASTVTRLAEKLAMSESQVLEYAGVPDSTFHSRKRAHKPLTADQSSRVYRIARVLAAAEAYFEGDQVAAKRWLTSPKLGLDGSSPLEFARTPEGSDYAVRLLQRMEHGVVS